MLDKDPSAETAHGLVTPREDFETMLEAEVVSAPGQFAVLVVDIDDLKDVNDTLGHATGDAFLGKALDVLQTYTSSIARGRASHIHGDEYWILLHDVTDDEKVEASIDGIRLALEEKGVAASIGGRLHVPDEGISDLLHDADAMMYANKMMRVLDKHNLSPEQEAKLNEHIEAIRGLGFISLREAQKFAIAIGWRGSLRPNPVPDNISQPVSAN